MLIFIRMAVYLLAVQACMVNWDMEFIAMRFYLDKLWN